VWGQSITQQYLKVFNNDKSKLHVSADFFSIKFEEAVDIKDEVSIKVEEAIDIKDEIPEAIIFPPIKTEKEVKHRNTYPPNTTHPGWRTNTRTHDGPDTEITTSQIQRIESTHNTLAHQQ